MKTFKVSEVIKEIDRLIHNKNQEKEKIQTLGDTVKKLNNLSTDDHKDTKITSSLIIHENIVLLFQSFINEYITALTDIKHNIEIFEDNDGMIRTDFLKKDVIQNLNELSHLTNNMVDHINKQYEKVSDLVVEGKVSTYYFNINIENAEKHVEKTVKKLESLEKENTSRLESSEQHLKEITQFINKI